MKNKILTMAMLVSMAFLQLRLMLLETSSPSAKSPVAVVMSAAINAKRTKMENVPKPLKPIKAKKVKSPHVAARKAKNPATKKKIQKTNQKTKNQPILSHKFFLFYSFRLWLEGS